MKLFSRLLVAALFSSMLAGVASAQPVRTGKHMMSLQWLGNEYGSMRIAAPDAQGWQRATGEMRNKEGLLQIDGKLKQVKPRELQFEGVIRSQAGFINDGKVCMRDAHTSFWQPASVNTGAYSKWKTAGNECGRLC